MTILEDRETLNNSLALDGAVEFRCDEEFRCLNPPLSVAELALLEALLTADGGAKDALVVWQEEQLLLDGYNRAAICARLRLPFTTRQVSLPDRQAARAWILRHQCGRRNLTPEGMAYLRGKRFEVEKGQPGGTGANPYRTPQDDKEQRGQSDTAARKTSLRLAEEFKVSPRTITRDAHFAEAVDVLAGIAEEVKRLVLSWNARISRGQVMRLASLADEQRRHAVRQLVETGEWSGSRTRRRSKTKVLLPRKPKAFAKSVLRLLGLRRAEAIRQALTAAIASAQEDNGAGKTAAE